MGDLPAIVTLWVLTHSIEGVVVDVVGRKVDKEGKMFFYTAGSLGQPTVHGHIRFTLTVFCKFTSHGTFQKRIAL